MVLKAEGWIENAEVGGEGIQKYVDITFAQDKPALELKRISKPGRRVYQSVKDIRPILNGFGSAIITTSAGLMTDVQAREKKMGGEVLCTIA